MLFLLFLLFLLLSILMIIIDIITFRLGYCQAGTSGEITEDFDIVIGSPGPYTWRGTVFTNSIRYIT